MQYPSSPAGMARDFSPRKKKAQLSFAQSSFVSSVMDDDSGAIDPRKVQGDIEFLYEQLKKVTQERDYLAEKNEVLSEELEAIHANFQEVAVRKRVDEDSFRKTLKLEKVAADKKFIKQTLKTQDRDNLLMDWINATVSNRLDERHVYLAEMVQRTGLLVPKARNLAQYISEQQNRFTKTAKSTSKSKASNSTQNQPNNYANNGNNGKSFNNAAGSEFDDALSSMSVLDNFKQIEENLSELAQGYSNYITLDLDTEGTDNELVVSNNLADSDAGYNSASGGNNLNANTAAASKPTKPSTGNKKKNTTATTTAKTSPRVKSRGGAAKRKGKKTQQVSDEEAASEEDPGQSSGGERGGRKQKAKGGKLHPTAQDYSALVDDDDEEESLYKLERTLGDAMHDFNLLNISLRGSSALGERPLYSAGGGEYMKVNSPGTAGAGGVTSSRYPESQSHSNKLYDGQDDLLLYSTNLAGKRAISANNSNNANSRAGGESRERQSEYSLYTSINNINNSDSSRLGSPAKYSGVVQQEEALRAQVELINTTDKYSSTAMESGGNGSGDGGNEEPMKSNINIIINKFDVNNDQQQQNNDIYSGGNYGNGNGYTSPARVDVRTPSEKVYNLQESIAATEEQLFSQYGNMNNGHLAHSQPGGHFNYDGVVANILNTVSEINRPITEDDARDEYRTAAATAANTARNQSPQHSPINRNYAQSTAQQPTAQAISALNQPSMLSVAGNSVAGGGHTPSKEVSYSQNFESKISYSQQFEDSGGTGAQKNSNNSNNNKNNTYNNNMDLQSPSADLYNMSSTISTIQAPAHQAQQVQSGRGGQSGAPGASKLNEGKSASSDKYWWDVSGDGAAAGAKGNKSGTTAQQPTQNSGSIYSDVVSVSDMLKLGGNLDSSDGEM